MVAQRLADLPSLIDIRAERARRHYRVFVYDAWQIVEPATPLVPGFYVDAVCDHLQAVAEGHLRQLLITIPPGFAKSTIVSVLYPAWRWIDHAEHRFLTTSHDSDLAIRDAVRSRRVMQSPWYQERWGDRFVFTSDQNVKSRYENDQSGYRVAAGVNSQLTGERADTVTCDDPHNVKHATSETIREATITWWREAMSTRLNDPKTGSRIVIQQRVHERDLAGVLAEQGYAHLNLPMEYEPTTYVTPIGWSDPRTEPGELLHPERYGPAEVTSIKTELGSQAYQAQYQQRPSPAEGGILKRHWWRFWHLPNQPLPPVTVKVGELLYSCPCVPLPPSFDDSLQSWDMSFKETKSGSFVVGQVWGKTQSNRYLVDQFRARVDFPDAVLAVEAMSAKHPHVVTKLVENKANGPAVVATLRSKLTGLIEVEPEGGKEARANAAAPVVESGNVYLPHPSLAPWVEGFIEECAGFPNAANDDQVDAFSQAQLRWTAQDDEGWSSSSYIGGRC